MSQLRDLYLKYKPCIVRIVVINHAGDLHTGTGFHIGDGLIVTARHVVQEMVRKPDIVGQIEVWSDRTIESVTREIDGQALAVTNRHHHSDNNVDLVVMETDFESHAFHGRLVVEGAKKRSVFIPIGCPVDDWI